MNFQIGKRLFEASLSLDAGLGQIDTILSGLSDEDEKKVWIERLGNVLRSVNEELVVPLLKLYPELDPDCDRP